MTAIDSNEEITGLMQISDSEFNSIRTIVYDNFGINLTEQKRSLVVGRLQKTLKSLKLSSFAEYHKYLNENPEALSDLVNRISTNHTFFFRENEHFEYFNSTVLPQIVQRQQMNKSNDIRLWCAASSSGEEPYTILMSMMEFFGRNYKDWDAGLLATDISENALATAVKGVYTDERMSLVPPSLKNKYFRKTGDDMWQVIDALKNEITFRRFNLMNTVLPFKKKFDVIFCRNVMIYFDQPTRDALVQRFFDAASPGAYLFIGHSETLGREKTRWRYIMPAVYRKDV